MHFLRLTTVFILTSCFSFGASNHKSTHHQFFEPLSPWHKIDAGTADVVFQQPEDHSTISLNSVCDQYEDLTLEELTRNLLQGISERKIVSSKKLTIQDNPAVQTVIAGVLDKDSFQGVFTVIRGKRCIYDVILIAKPAVFAKHLDVYQDSLKSLTGE